LSIGDFDESKALLGRPYFMSGKVVYGNQIGRQLGVPTANVNLKRHKSPLKGVFAVKVRIPSLSTDIFGVANVGVRPSVDGLEKPVLEVHLFDFSEDIYGKTISVEFCSKIRDEQRFESLDILKAKIAADIVCAKQFFNIESLG
jgi:riboflavin kinase/FMN adenylyltransferase